MKSKKQLLLFGVAVAGALSVISLSLHSQWKEGQFFGVDAGECNHEVVEHYESTSTHIEHWACCQCHHAWADAERTILLSEDTRTDRSKIDVSDTYAFTLDWDQTKFLPYYDEEFGYVYRTSGANITGTDWHYVETISPEITDDAIKGAMFTLRNNTNVKFKLQIRTRAWNQIIVSDDFIEPGESKDLFVTKERWNTDPSGSNHGLSVWCQNTSEETVSGTIEASAPRFLDYDIENYYGQVAIHSGSDWIYKASSPISDPNFDYVHQIYVKDSSELFFESQDTATSLPEGKAYYMQVTNNTGKDVYARAVGREWGGAAGESITLKAGETSLVYATAETWNSQNKKGVAIRLAPVDGGTFTGKLSVSNPVIVDEAELYSQFFDHIEAADQTSDNWKLLPVHLGYDKNHGLYYHFDASNLQGTLRIYFRQVVKFADTYSHIRFYMFNGGDDGRGVNLINESWADPTTHIDALTPKAWTMVDVLSGTWNGQSDSIGLYDMGFNSEVRITFGELITK